MDRGAWLATIHEVAKSQAQLSDQHYFSQTEPVTQGSLASNSNTPHLHQLLAYDSSTDSPSLSLVRSRSGTAQQFMRWFDNRSQSLGA